MYVCIYVSLTGQTAGLNWLTFFEESFWYLVGNRINFFERSNTEELRGHKVFPVLLHKFDLLSTGCNMTLGE